MKIYKIVRYDLIDAQFYTYELLELDVKEIKRYSNGKISKVIFIDDSTIESNNYYTLSENPKGIDKKTNKFLPYRANVTEDLPSSATKHGLKPKTFKNCLLMIEKHGGYLQFHHEETDKILLIAMNSNYYTPIN